jgi:hypothetical protein
MPQCSTLVQGNMIGFVASDLVLWIVHVGVVDVAFVVYVLGVHPHDTSADPARFGIPTHVIADLEYLGHDEISPETRFYAWIRCWSQRYEFRRAF